MHILQRTAFLPIARFERASDGGEGLIMRDEEAETLDIPDDVREDCFGDGDAVVG